MGLSNKEKYRMSAHAIKRFKERFDRNVSNVEMNKTMARVLNNAEFLSEEHNNTQSWYDKEEGIILILDPKKHNIVTLYDSDDQYGNARRNTIMELAEKEELVVEDDSKVDVKELHPRVEEILTELVSERYKIEEKHYMASLGPLYKEYGERLDNLSRMKRPDTIQQKRIEIQGIMESIKSVKEESNEVLNGLKQYM